MVRPKGPADHFCFCPCMVLIMTTEHMPHTAMVPPRLPIQSPAFNIWKGLREPLNTFPYTFLATQRKWFIAVLKNWAAGFINITLAQGVRFRNRLLAKRKICWGIKRVLRKGGGGGNHPPYPRKSFWRLWKLIGFSKCQNERENPGRNMGGVDQFGWS